MNFCAVARTGSGRMHAGRPGCGGAARGLGALRGRATANQG